MSIEHPTTRSTTLLLRSTTTTTQSRTSRSTHDESRATTAIMHASPLAFPILKIDEQGLRNFDPQDPSDLHRLWSSESPSHRHPLVS